MSQSVADRNLLFGVLAMQMDFISRDQLVAAMQAWVFDKQKSLGEILVAQKALPEDNRSLLETLVQKHLIKHNNDPEKSLAAVNPTEHLCRELERITDTDVQASLMRIPAAAARLDPYATIAPTPITGTDVPTSLMHNPAAPARLDSYGTIAPTPSMLTAGASLRFRIVRPHARGGLGEVFVALDEELHREVALKEIQERQADNQESRARFMLEAEITGGLEHPGIVPVYGLGAYPDGRPYYAMRFIRGDSLKDAIERFHRNQNKMSASERTLELRGLLGRFVDVCNAIAYAHSRGILHRDLKPGNIMLGKYGETLVVDWGLAKPLGEMPEGTGSLEPGEGSLVPSSMSSASETIAGSAVGTPQYMSPEQAAGRLDQLGPASDVYSLGATLYCILTGISPVSDNDVGMVLRRVQRGDFSKPSDVVGGIHPALEAICLKAMSLKPADRYQTPHALGDDIEHWLADEPVAAWPEPWTTKARRWIGRNATLVTSVASAIAVALVGLIVATILLTAANERERLAKQKADDNFKLAIQAVHDYHTKVSQDDLLHEPGMQPLRKRLLESAAVFYKKFVGEKADDPSVRGEFARANYRLSHITGEIGSKSEAIELDKKAAGIFEELAAAKSKEDFRADQAACYDHLGLLYRTTDNLAEADKYFVKALTVWESLVAEQPKEPRFQAGLARTNMRLGNLNQHARKLDAATENYGKSLKAWDELVKSSAAPQEDQREIAVNHANLGNIYLAQQGKEKDAERAFRSAWTIQKKLVENAPNIGKYQLDFAKTSHSLGRIMYGSADSKEDAKTYYQEAVDRMQALAQLHPAVTDYQTRLANAFMDLSVYYREKNDLQDAEAASKNALAIHRRLVDKNKDDESLHGDLARGLHSFAKVCLADTKVDRTKEAETSLYEAIGLQEKLASKPGAPANLKRDLAQMYGGMGQLHTLKLRDEKAADAYKTSVTWWEKLVKDNPSEHEYVVGLSNSFNKLGNLAKLAGKFDQAQPWFAQAVKNLDRLDKKALDNPQVNNSMFFAYMGRAESLSNLAKHDDALKDWNRAFDLARVSDKPFVLLQRAAAIARTGKHAEAVAEIAPYQGKTKAGESLFRFACVYALASGAAKDRKEIADQYATEAMKLLNAADNGNFFDSLKNQKKLLDADLDPLRDRPEFQKFIKSIESR